MALLQRIANLFRGHKLRREIEAELRSHTEMRIEDNIAAGMSPEKARRDALLRFGNVTLASERVTAADTVLHVESLARDLRYGVRQLRRSPGFALTAILTLALGIAANVIVFGVLNALLLRPLNVAWRRQPLSGGAAARRATGTNPIPITSITGRATQGLRDMVAYRLNMLAFSAGGNREKRWSTRFPAITLTCLSVQPQLGGFFH